MEQFLLQWKWYRDLFDERTFYKHDNKWKDLKDFKKGEKITHIAGHWNTQAFCECGNELVHSQSFLRERYVEHTEQCVYDYKCSSCGVKLYFNPDIIPGLMGCNEYGIPPKSKTKDIFEELWKTCPIDGCSAKVCKALNSDKCFVHTKGHRIWKLLRIRWNNLFK